MIEVIRLSVDIQSLSPRGFLPFAPGLYTCIKSLKMCIKSDFEEIILNLAKYGQREKAFLFSSKVLSPMDCLPLPGAIDTR